MNRTPFWLLLSLLSVPLARADVRLPAVISDHMVLQTGKPVPVWGWANPAEKVAVSFAGQSVSTEADASGQWRVTLKALDVNSKSNVLTVTGKNTLTVSDVLVGEAWLCSGT